MLKYDFLMQAMLSLAASNLAVTSTSPLLSTALSYRGLAISGLNTALSTPPKNKADADAILATCWILACVTMYLGESVEEFFTMVRGISVVLNQDWGSKYGTSFLKLEGGGQEDVIKSRVIDVPLLPENLVAEAWESIDMMKRLDMQGVEEDVFRLQAEVVRLLSISSLEGLSPPLTTTISRLRSYQHTSSTGKYIPSSLSSHTRNFRLSLIHQIPMHKFSWPITWHCWF